MREIDDIHEWSKSKPAKEFFEEQFGITKVPCRAQFYNILGSVDAQKFNKIFIKWMNGVLAMTGRGKTVSLDGKEIRGVRKLTENGKGLNIVSAVVSESNLVIGSMECGDKKGEVTALRELLELLDVSGGIVVADALHCKKKTAEAVIDAGADYLFVVKDNEPKLKAGIESLIYEEHTETSFTVEKNGGRYERRTAYVTSQVGQIDGHEKWLNLSSVGAISREVEKNNKVSMEWHYYISSAHLTAEEFLHHARMEWRVESMHWLLDVHFQEDKTRIWDINVQKLLNTGRKIALNLARLFKEHNCKPRTALSDIFKRNLFDVDTLAGFIEYFQQNGVNSQKLD